MIHNLSRELKSKLNLLVGISSLTDKAKMLYSRERDSTKNVT